MKKNTDTKNDSFDENVEETFDDFEGSEQEWEYGTENVDDEETVEDPFNSPFNSSFNGPFGSPLGSPFGIPFNDPNRNKSNLDDRLKRELNSNYSNKICNVNKPFAFISYTHSGFYNNFVVMEIFNRLYDDAGYNLWIDFANLEKDESHWNVAARKAIFSHNCKLVLFIRNEFSTINKNVYKELELAHARHIPIVPIDAWQFANSAVEYREFLVNNATADPFLAFENVADIVSVEANTIQCKINKENKEKNNTPGFISSISPFEPDYTKEKEYEEEYEESKNMAKDAVEDIIELIKEQLNKKGVYDRTVKNTFRLLSEIESDAMKTKGKENLVKLDASFFNIDDTILEYDLYNKKAELLLKKGEDELFAILLKEVFAFTKYSEIRIPKGVYNEFVDQKNNSIKVPAFEDIKRKYLEEKNGANNQFFPYDNNSDKNHKKLHDETLRWKVYCYLFVSNRVLQLDKNIYCLTENFPPLDSYYIGNNSEREVDVSFDDWSGFKGRAEKQFKDISKLKNDVRLKDLNTDEIKAYRVDFAEVNRVLLENNWPELSLEEQNDLLADVKIYEALFLGEKDNTQFLGYPGGDNTGIKKEEVTVKEMANRVIRQWDNYEITKKYCAEMNKKDRVQVLVRITSNNSCLNFFSQSRDARYLGVLLKRFSKNGDIYYLQSVRDYYNDRNKYDFYNDASFTEKVEWDSHSQDFMVDVFNLDKEYYEIIREAKEPILREMDLVEHENDLRERYWLYGSELYYTFEPFGNNDAKSCKTYKTYNEINENEIYQWWNERIEKRQKQTNHGRIEDKNSTEDIEERWYKIRDRFIGEDSIGLECIKEIKEKYNGEKMKGKIISAFHYNFDSNTFCITITNNKQTYALLFMKGSMIRITPEYEGKKKLDIDPRVIEASDEKGGCKEYIYLRTGKYKKETVQGVLDKLHLTSITFNNPIGYCYYNHDGNTNNYSEMINFYERLNEFIEKNKLISASSVKG